jgi:DNA-binding CsgD family transcriptional regulator
MDTLEDKIKRSLKTKAARAGPPSSSVEALIRQIVAQVDSVRSLLPHPRCRDSPAERVLVDTEVDGVRCILLRISESNAPRQSLSPREKEIARMVAKGYPNKMIASVLEISSWTVGTYLRRMFAKLGVCSRAALVASLAESDHLLAVPESHSPPSHEPLPQVSDDHATQVSRVRGS